MSIVPALRLRFAAGISVVALIAGTDLPVQAQASLGKSMTPPEGNWMPGFHISGPLGNALASAIGPDGNFYVGGSFTFPGNEEVTGIGKWNGIEWSILSLGPSGNVRAILFKDDTLIVGGAFTMAGGAPGNNIAKWDGSSWSTFGTGFDGSVNALVLKDDTLFAGGAFNMADGSPASRVAEWNGSSWSALGAGLGSVVNSLAVGHGNLYAGGVFTTPATRIAMWDGSTWSALGTGMNSTVHSLAFGNDTLYAGGSFTTAGGTPVNYVAKWDGSSWADLDGGMSTTVQSVALIGDSLFAGGYFTTSGGVPANRIAMWTDGAWHAFGAGLSDGVESVAASNDTLLVGGVFYAAETERAGRVASWYGGTWHSLSAGDGIGGNGAQVDALLVGDGILYAGGNFNSAGDILVNHIAAWDGAQWDSLGAGLSGSSTPFVRDFTYHDHSLYVAGAFSTAGGIAASNIAAWDGSSWSALGSGLNADAFSLAFKGDTLFAGGFFTMAGGNSASFIAKWDGASWYPVGSGLNGPAYDLIVKDDTLYAAGLFTTAGGSPANNIAKWDGATWSPLGGGITVSIGAFSLEFGGDILYVGGDITNSIIQWDGSTWSTLGDGPRGFIEAMVYCSGELIVGGNFFADPAHNISKGIAKWDGVSWDSVGSGINGNVYSLALGSLYVGGSFTLAGDVPSNNIALDPNVSCETLPVELVRFRGVSDDGFILLTWQTASERDNAGFSVESFRTDGAWREVGFVPGAGTSEVPTSYTYRIEAPDPGIHRYRLKQVDFDGSFDYSKVVEVTVEVPGTHELTAAWPNPFSSRTQLSLTVSRRQHVRVSLFDALGRHVAKLYEGEMNANRRTTISIDAHGLAGGIYLVRAEGEQFSEVRQVTTVR